jgi:cellulose synthase/poly-beta-1,6-N-acetylglucosamine synthase-like glycosyltransferase
MFKAFPLFVLPLVAYNLLMLSGDIEAALAAELFSIGLISDAVWSFSVHDAFVVAGVLILYFEIFKSTRTGIASVLDHTFSTMVFVVFLIELLTVAACGTSTFFVLGLMALLDVMAGFTVSIVAARRDFGVNNPGFGGD